MRKFVFFAFITLLAIGCSTQKTIVKVEKSVVNIPKEETHSLKRKVAIARFSNETQYAKGAFYDKENDPLGKQTVDILSTKLAASGKFLLLERVDYDKIMTEINKFGNNSVQKVGADYLIIGSLTEYGRKNVGDVGVFSRSKEQVVYAGVSIRLVDVSTGQIIYSEEAKGEASTKDKTIMGLGKRTDYDATLNDKAISVAISKLVENIINNCMNRPWKSYFINYDENGIIISGGKSQGISVGDKFDIFTKGKKIKNPQTGMLIELPGKNVGTIQIDLTGGDTTESEYSIVSIIKGSIDKSDISKYYIKEIK